MNKNLIAALIMVLVSTSILAQKTEKLKYKGFIQSKPIIEAPSVNFKFKFDSLGQKSETSYQYKYDLKGVVKGDDYKVYGFIEDPVLTRKKEKVKKADGTTVYEERVYAHSPSGVYVYKKGEGLVLRFSTTPAKERTYKTLSTMAAGQKNANHDFFAKAYLRDLFEAYKLELNNYFGNFYKEANYRLFVMKKSKQFDYTSFNEASKQFQTITEKSELTEEDKKKISEIIDVWKSYESEYKEGKKQKVCDDNIVDIRLNIVTGYLALNNAEEGLDYWKKANLKNSSLGVKLLMRLIVDDSKHKTYLKEFFQNYNDEVSELEKYNKMVFESLFMNCAISDELGYNNISNFFSNNTIHLKSHSKILSVGSKKEIIKINYNHQQNIASINCKGRNGNIDYKVAYGKDGVSSVMVNKEAAFDVEYDQKTKKIANIIDNNYKDGIRADYKFEDDGSGNIKITKSYLYDNGNVKLANDRYYCKYNQKKEIESLFFENYSAKGMVYDENSNLKTAIVKGLSMTEYELGYENECNTYGNVTKVMENGKVDAVIEYENRF